jgi:four helix bundle protein
LQETDGVLFAKDDRMAVKQLEDLVVYQFAGNFKLEVYGLIEASPPAQRSLKYREQLEEACAGIERAIAEGFGRHRPTEFAQFLRYAQGSLAEATTCLRDGIHRKYFNEPDCETAFRWAERCKSAMIKLLVTQIPKRKSRHTTAALPQPPRRRNNRNPSGGRKGSES